MVDCKSVVSTQKCIDYIERLPFMVIFLCSLYIFVVKKYRLYRKMIIYGHFSIFSIHFLWIRYFCLANMFILFIFLNPSNSVTKRLKYFMIEKKNKIVSYLEQGRIIWLSFFSLESCYLN